MATDEILKLLVAERNKIDAAIQALSGGGGGNIPSKTLKAQETHGKTGTAKRVISPEAREKMAKAQQARWAKVKKAAKTAAKKAEA